MTTVEEVKKRGRENHLTNAYNFAGPGTFYSARMRGSDFYENLMKEAGKRIVGTKPYNVPINKLDTCAKSHDKVYNNKNATGDEVQQADRVFQDCIGKIKPSDGIQQTLLAKAAIVGFDAKLAAEDSGIIRKGSLSDGGDKKSGLGIKLSNLESFGKKASNKIKRGLKLNG